MIPHLYEHSTEPLTSKTVYYRRIGSHLALACLVMGICLLIGSVSYHITVGAGWLDAFHNSCMILSGMGPVITITDNAGKWFSAFYALFSGIVFITNSGLILAPAIHRILHALHMDGR